MILYLNSTIEELEIEGGLKRSALVEHLLQCHRRGLHLVVIERDVIRWLLEQGGISAVGISLLNRMHGEFTQSGDLLRRAGIIVGVRTARCSRALRRNEVAVTFEEFEAFELGQPATLLLENAATDGEIFRFLLELEARKAGIQRLSLQLHNGGGADTVNQLRRLIEERRAVFCVVDRDSSGPHTPLGHKIRTLRRVLDETAWELCELAVTPGREVENFLSLSILQLLRCWPGQTSRAFLLSILQAEPDEFDIDGFWLHFDVKQGLREEEWSAMNANERERILTCFRRVGKTCLEEIEGFGDSVVQCWSSEPRAKSALAGLVRQQSWSNAFGGFFAVMLWFFVSVPPKYV